MLAFLKGVLLQVFWYIVNSIWPGDVFNISWTLVQVMASCLKVIHKENSRLLNQFLSPHIYTMN